MSFVEKVACVLSLGKTFALVGNVVPEDGMLDAFVNQLEKRHDPTHIRSQRGLAWQYWLSDAGFTIVETDHFMKMLSTSHR